MTPETKAVLLASIAAHEATIQNLPEDEREAAQEETDKARANVENCP